MSNHVYRAFRSRSHRALLRIESFETWLTERQTQIVGRAGL